MYMVVTGIKYHYPNIRPNCIYIRYLCLGQATTRIGLALGVSEKGDLPGLSQTCSIGLKSMLCVLRKFTVSLVCMRGGIIMLKNRDVGVVIEQRNDAMSENVIAVPLSI